MPLLKLHRSSLFQPVGEDALLGAFATYSTKTGACSLYNIVETVLVFKQVDEMDISPTERLIYISSANQRLEQHLPDYVDLTPS